MTPRGLHLYPATHLGKIGRYQIQVLRDTKGSKRSERDLSLKEAHKQQIKVFEHEEENRSRLQNYLTKKELIF
ncbi:Tripartite Motif-Containing Protein 75-Like [Manis pentadactyla]|nr:Tripartite Motif-Containing Protein 75-Like [Manis pentadactyla]